MPSNAAVIEVETILTPIPGENPSGENLLYAGVHDEIREARRADDPTAKADWQAELKAADWAEVVSVGTSALKSRTKDLQIAAWLCEALVNKHGFAGLRDGLKVMRGFHELFWDSLYPEIDDGDLDARANCLALMDRQTAMALKGVPLTEVRGNGNFNYLQWEKTRLPDDYSKIAQGNKAEADRIKQESEKANEDWSCLNRATPRRFYEEVFTLVSECWEEFQGLDRSMDTRFGRQTPGLGELKKSLDSVRSLLDKLVKEKRALEPDPIAGPSGEEGAEMAAEEGGAQPAGTAVVPASGAIRGRQDALRRLSEIADFFQKTEPHSPVSYLVGRAVKWGNMPLEQWLQEVVKDSSVLAQIQETLGVRPPESGGSY
ncbi:MAG: type VI secretion system protein TssA [Acidobacteria bacterium]|nr:type VI secretion system protein TssA [Acidobacteriota bacterium]